MARVPSLKHADETVTFWHRALAPFVAGVWSHRAAPPVTAAAAPFYAGALKDDASGAAQTALARCLLWCDAEAAQFVPSRLGWYRVAARAFPDDERCAFFLAALCRQEVVQDAAAATQAYAALTRPDWKASRFWDAFDLPQRAITDELAVLYAEGDVVSPERVAAVEAAYAAAARPGGGHTHEQRAAFVAYLARARRLENRQDEDALVLIAARFAQDPDDLENAAYLGEVYAEADRSDPAACRVFARLACAAEETKARPWTLRLARAHVAAGRVGPDTLPILREAARALPDDADLAAARAAACAPVALPAPDDLAALEDVLGREADFVPVFAAHGWPFAPIVRAVALAWGRARRMDDGSDEAARALFARAAVLFAADPTLSLFHARALAAAGQFDQAAVPVYEKAWADSKKSDHAILAALGRAYVQTEAAGIERVTTAARRAQIVAVWESLFRQGLGWPELIRALAQAYTYENRVGDVALQVWEQVAADETGNGSVRACLGREWRRRGDEDAALRWYREAAELLPRDGETQFAAGVLVREKGDLAGAEKMLVRAARLCPAHREAHFALAETLLAQDKKEAATSVFQTIVDTMDANHAPTLLHLSKLNPNREQGRSDKPSAAPGDADAQHRLADLYIARGDYQSAETALRQVIALGAGDRKTYTLLGEVMVQARAKAA